MNLAAPVPAAIARMEAWGSMRRASAWVTAPKRNRHVLPKEKEKKRKDYFLDKSRRGGLKPTPALTKNVSHLDWLYETYV